MDAASGIARLTLTNTRHTNPLSLGLMRHATRLLQDEVAPSSDVRALVLTAEPGAKFFSSGHDLDDVFVRQGKHGAVSLMIVGGRRMQDGDDAEEFTLLVRGC